MVSAFKQRLVERVVVGGFTPVDRHAPPIIPGYATHACLGEGGMGEVWSAHSDAGRPVAIKLMKRSAALDPESRHRFLREARAVASVDHPGVVDVSEVGVAGDDRPFMVMERLEGWTLRDALTDAQPPSWSEASEILVQVARAVAGAHQRGIVHRDIKPANIMVVRDGERVACKVIDFGLARRQMIDEETAQITVTGQVLGTPAYMSPEGLRGAAADARSDVYALGCVAYELLEGRRPFYGDTIAELFYAHLSRPVPRPTLPSVPPPLAPQVRAVLARALRKDPADRFASMDELAAAISKVGAGRKPIALLDDPGLGSSRSAPASGRRGRSRRVLAIAAGVGLTAVAVGAFAGGVPWGEPGPADVEITAVTTGIALTCAAARGGEIKCWGSDSFGRLGHGTNGENVGDNEHPATIPPITVGAKPELAALVSSADARHVCALWADGTARCWGQNVAGQLGLGTTNPWGDEPHETVDALPDLPLAGVQQLATGTKNTCAVVSSGAAHCWGEGGHGIRGDGSESSFGDDESIDAVPRVAVGAREIRGISLGKRHACAVLDGDEVRCWGGNDHGQLGTRGWRHAIGDGTGDGQGRGARPDDARLAVTGLAGVGVTSVHAAASRSCVVTQAGGVRCWGRDAYGVIGYPPSLELSCAETSAEGECDIDTPPPVDLDLDDARIVALSLGEIHTCALDDTGAVRCWGNAGWGMLGEGEVPMRVHADRSMEAGTRGPDARVVDLGDFDGDGRLDPAVQIAAANFHACARMRDGGLRCWGRGQSGRLGYASSDNVGDNETPAAYYAALGSPNVRAF